MPSTAAAVAAAAAADDDDDDDEEEEEGKMMDVERPASSRADITRLKSPEPGGLACMTLMHVHVYMYLYIVPGTNVC